MPNNTFRTLDPLITNFCAKVEANEHCTTIELQLLARIIRNKKYSFLQSYFRNQFFSLFSNEQYPKKSLSTADACSIVLLKEYGIDASTVWGEFKSINWNTLIPDPKSSKNKLPFHVFVNIIFQSVLHQRATLYSSTQGTSNGTNFFNVNRLYKKPNMQLFASINNRITTSLLFKNYIICLHLQH